MYLNVIQLAESLGVEESVIEGWVRNEGLPHVPERGHLLFDRVQVATWAAQRGLAAKVGFLAPEAQRPIRGLRLEPLLRSGGIWRDVAVSAVLGTLETVVGLLPTATPAVLQLLKQRVRSPGGIVWAPVGGGLALPHLRVPVALGRDAGILALLFLRGIPEMNEPAPDGFPVTRMLFFIAPSPRAHLEVLARLSSALSHGGLRRLVLDEASDGEILAAFAQSDDADPDREPGSGGA